MNVAISHHTSSQISNIESTDRIVFEIIQRLETQDQLFLPLEETKQLLFQLKEFELGRFLLHNRGLNGYWTAYIFRNDVDNAQLTPLESWLLNKSFYVMARERFVVFQREIKQRLHSHMTLASIPCGLMDDLLHLDYTSFTDIQLVGIDADTESLELARQNARNNRIDERMVRFFQKDAWDLQVENQYDLLTSNGLNMYESSEARLIALYRSFYNALRPEGTLIMSFIPPPAEGSDLGISPEDFLKERAIFGDIIQVNYLNFCTENTLKRQLESIGFRLEDILYNSVGMAPVVIAKK